MKKFLFYTLCVTLFKTSIQENLIAISNSYKPHDNYAKLKVMEKYIDQEMRHKKDHSISTKKLQILQKYVITQIKKHQEKQNILRKIVKENIPLSHICKQELFKTLSHKKITKIFN